MRPTAALAAMAAVALAAVGCEEIRPWEPDGGTDAGDAGDAGDGGDLGDGGTGAYLASFGPGGQFLRAPSDGGTTALTVRILRGGESGPVTVGITSSNPVVASVLNDAVVIPAGLNALAVPLRSGGTGAVVLTARFDGGTIDAGLTVLPTVVISEYAAEGLAGSDDEFLELYNPTPLDFSLAGFVVQYRSTNGSGTYLPVLALDGGARIGSYRHFLIGVNTYSGPAADAVALGSGVAFSNSGGSIRLGAPGIGTGSTDPLAIDTLGYGSGSLSFEGTPYDGGLSWGSLERKASATSTALSMGTSEASAGNAYDTNVNTADFVNRAVRDPQNLASAPETPP